MNNATSYEKNFSNQYNPKEPNHSLLKISRFPSKIIIPHIFLGFRKTGHELSLMALKSEDPVPGVSKADNLVNWLGMEMDKTPATSAIPMLPFAKKKISTKPIFE